MFKHSPKLKSTLTTSRRVRHLTRAGKLNYLPKRDLLWHPFFTKQNEMSLMYT